MKATELLKTSEANENVQDTINRYAERFNAGKSKAEERLREAAQVSMEYYGLATDFYLHGWGRLFHFGVRKKGEGLKDSLEHHEKFLAEKLDLKAGERCLDIGCGVAGPMINMVKNTGASITGINNSSYQLAKARQFIHEERVEKNCSFLECNWLDIPLRSEGFDKAYAIEATCHAADKWKELFGEISRLLKPGGLFGGYDWVMTEKFDPAQPEHMGIKEKIEIGNGVSNLNIAADLKKALVDAGFEVLECRDMAHDCDPETPWYLPLAGKRFSLSSLRTSPVGRFFMKHMLRALEVIRLVPKGSAQVHKVLEIAADGLVRGGQTDIFTPMLFFLARKPA